jgi:hypothetical protein
MAVGTEKEMTSSFSSFPSLFGGSGGGGSSECRTMKKRNNDERLLLPVLPRLASGPEKPSRLLLFSTVPPAEDARRSRREVCNACSFRPNRGLV